jgi:hypothetical protein
VHVDRDASVDNPFNAGMIVSVSSNLPQKNVTRTRAASIIITVNPPNKKDITEISHQIGD